MNRILVSAALLLATWLPATLVPALLAGSARIALAQATYDGLRTITVQRFGVEVHAPLAWNLTNWGQDDRAFELRLPQEKQSPPGYVVCDLAVAPASLREFQRQRQAATGQEQSARLPRRKLVLDQIEPLDAKRFGKEQAEQLKERLVTLWESQDAKGPKRFEMCSRVISHDTLYSFTFTTDEAHFAAYRVDFEDMLASARFSPPETGLQRMPGGYWMQREFRFALRVPADWKPAFGPSDKSLFFATGKRHELFADSLVVVASPAAELDLEALKAHWPEQIKKADESARVPSCEIVPQGGGKALETLIHTKRGPLDVTILDRRFRLDKRNYEVKITCESSEFEKIEAELRKALDSFVEIADQPRDETL